MTKEKKTRKAGFVFLPIVTAVLMFSVFPLKTYAESKLMPEIVRYEISNRTILAVISEAAARDVAGYELELSSDSKERYYRISGRNNVKFTVKNLENGKEYGLRIRYYSSSGKTSAFSEQIFATPGPTRQVISAIRQMRYGGKAKKAMTISLTGGGTRKIEKGETVLVVEKKKKKKKYMLMFTDGTTAEVPKNSIKLKTQLTNSKTVYTKATAEAFINSKQAGYVGSETEYLFYCSKYTQHVYVFKGSSRNWHLIRTMKCTTGSYKYGVDTTNSFSYKIYNKYKKYRSNRGVLYYCMHFSSPGGNSIHQRGSSSLGKPNTHGCIGLKKKDAVWVYRHLPVNTRVVVY